MILKNCVGREGFFGGGDFLNIFLETLRIFFFLRNIENFPMILKPKSTYRYQYSIYAGRHVVPGLEGLLLEYTADVNQVWSPLSVPRWSSTARLITKHLVNMIKVCLCSKNDGDY